MSQHGSRARWVIALVALLLVVGGGVALAASGAEDGERVEVLMPNATGVVDGDEVLMQGQVVGTIAGKPEVTGQPGDPNRALVAVNLDSQYVPLRQGTNARIAWEATVGERALELLPGPPGAPPMAAGQRIVSGHERVELDQVLAALDPPTRQHLNGLVQQVSQTLGGQERNLNATLRTGGPAVEALGEVLKAVGSDGPALRRLITQVREVTDVLSKRRGELAGTIQQLRPVTEAVGNEQDQLSSTLEELPPTLRQASSTLGQVPDTVDAALPLVKDLKPATAQLPSVASKLKPILHDLRPVVGDLKDTLGDANDLLDRTPNLLDRTHGVLPPLTYTVKSLRPALAFLRPYAPETMGWLANWNSLFASTTAPGEYARNYGRALVTESGSSLDDNPTDQPPPGMQLDPAPVPGSSVGQPWTDANGDGLS